MGRTKYNMLIRLEAASDDLKLLIPDKSGYAVVVLIRNRLYGSIVSENCSFLSNGSHDMLYR